MKVCVGVNLCPFPTEQLQNGGCFEHWEDFSFLLDEIQLVLYHSYNSITTWTTPETRECTTPIVIWTRSKMSLVNILTTQFFSETKHFWIPAFGCCPWHHFVGLTFDVSVKSDLTNENTLLNQSVQLFFQKGPCGPWGVSTGYWAKALKRLRTDTANKDYCMCL